VLGAVPVAVPATVAKLAGVLRGPPGRGWVPVTVAMPVAVPAAAYPRLPPIHLLQDGLPLLGLGTRALHHRHPPAAGHLHGPPGMLVVHSDHSCLLLPGEGGLLVVAQRRAERFQVRGVLAADAVVVVAPLVLVLEEQLAAEPAHVRDVVVLPDHLLEAVLVQLDPVRIELDLQAEREHGRFLLLDLHVAVVVGAHDERQHGLDEGLLELSLHRRQDLLVLVHQVHQLVHVRPLLFGDVVQGRFHLLQLVGLRLELVHVLHHVVHRVREVVPHPPQLVHGRPQAGALGEAAPVLGHDGGLDQAQPAHDEHGRGRHRDHGRRGRRQAADGEGARPHALEGQPALVPRVRICGGR